METCMQALWPSLALARTLWRSIAAARRRHRRARLDRIAFDGLDDHALRDLGMDWTEYGSYHAEANGMAERSRRHLSW